MKKISLFIAALFAAAAFSACQKTDNQPEAPGEYILTVEASMPAPDTKGLSLSGKTLNAVWAATDKVTVLNGSTNLGTLAPQTSGSATASLKGTLSGSVSVGQTLTLLTPKSSVMYTNQDGTLGKLASDYAYAKATITVTAVSGKTISAAPAQFENQQAIVKFTLKNKGTTLCVDDLKIEAASGKLVKVIADNTSYGAIELDNDDEEDALYVALRNDSGAADTYTLTATVGSTVYTCTKAGVLFQNGKYYGVTANMDEVVEHYTVAGTPKSVFGGTKDWDEKNTDYMVKNGDVYEKSFTVPSTMTVAFKVVKDNTWGDAGVNNWPADGNKSITVGAGTLKIVFNPGNKSITCTYPEPGTVTHTYIVAGNTDADHPNIFGTSWDSSNTANKMTKQSDGSYTKLYQSVAAGTVMSFKVVEDGVTWHGKNGVTDLETDKDQNCVYTVTSAGNVTIKYEPSNEKISIIR